MRLQQQHQWQRGSSSCKSVRSRISTKSRSDLARDRFGVEISQVSAARERRFCNKMSRVSYALGRPTLCRSNVSELCAELKSRSRLGFFNGKGQSNWLNQFTTTHTLQTGQDMEIVRVASRDRRAHAANTQQRFDVVITVSFGEWEKKKKTWTKLFLALKNLQNSSSVSLTLSAERYCCFDIENSAYFSYSRDPTHSRCWAQSANKPNIKLECQRARWKCCKAQKHQNTEKSRKTLSINSVSAESLPQSSRALHCFQLILSCNCCKSRERRENRAELWNLSTAEMTRLDRSKKSFFFHSFHTSKKAEGKHQKVCNTAERWELSWERRWLACVAQK